MLNHLSEILGVSVSEILNGERKSIIKIDDITDKIKYYIKKNSVKNIKISIIIILLILAIFSVLFLINNFNQFKVYKVSSDEKSNYVIDGYMILNQKRNFIIIRNIDLRKKIDGTSDEIFVKYLRVVLYNQDKVLYEVTFGNYEDSVLINEYLINRSIFLEENIGLAKDKLKNIKDTNFYILLEYSEDNEQIDKVKIPLKIQKDYANNKVIY